MDNTVVAIVVVVLVVLALAGFAAWAYMRRQRSERLRERFGPEYERAVREYGDEKLAEERLRERQERVAALELRAVPAADRMRYAAAWREAQARFVDDPPAAIADANELIKGVMQARGYPMAHFDQRAEDISVHYPEVVQHYRAARGIADRSQRGQAGTEELRQAMVHYRALFQELLEGDNADDAPERGGRAGRGEEADRTPRGGSSTKVA